MFFVVFLLVSLGFVEIASLPPSKGAKRSCLLPAFPVNGNYTSSSESGVPRPGDEVNRLTALEYSCNPGYFLTEEVSVCRGNNIWSSNPACKKVCTLYNSDTVEYSCFDDQSEPIVCDPAMPHGSYVTFECKNRHALSGTETLEEMVCSDGYWSRNLPECKIECGLENAEISPFITKAAIAPKDSLPWHVAVYEGTDPSFQYICGGTIIRPRLVIGAAHCFHDPERKQAMPVELYRVAAGKHYQAWMHEAEPNAPTSEVREIRLPQWYTGNLHHHQNDLALVVLETPFDFSNSVGAICWDVANQRFDKNQLVPGSEGKFAGWGVTEDRMTSDELRVLRVPVIDQQACSTEYERYYSERYITSDKICAGFINGSTGCNGDSGAGLVFPSFSHGEKRWWLRAVLSVGPRETNSDLCRNNTYTAYTRVFALADWLKKQINELSSKKELYQVTCSLPQSNSVDFKCLDSDKSPIRCGRKFVDGMFIDPWCKEGFTVKFQEKLVTLTCQQGQWDNPIPTCIPIPKTNSSELTLDGFNCISPSYPVNGKYKPMDSTEELLPGKIVDEYTVIIYECDTNYEISSSNAFSICLDAEWYPPPEVCKLADKTCPPLPKTAVTAQKTGQKAWDKCIELAESVYPCDKSTGIRGYSCAHVATPLIIGGVDVTPGEFPHMAHIGFTTGQNDSINWLCGGTLVSERWVLTASICLRNYKAGRAKEGHVRLGGSEIGGGKPDDMYKIVQMVVHPEYNVSSIYNDIGLVKLDRDVQYTKLVRPACLHTGAGGPVSDDKAIATGWGTTDIYGTLSERMLKVNLEKFSIDECSNLYNFTIIDNATQACFGHHTEEKDTCVGDSGGPLQIYNGKEVDCTYLVIGVTSFGKGCGLSGFPAIYTNVSAYIPWIESVVWPDIDALRAALFNEVNLRLDLVPSMNSTEQ